MAQHYEKPHTAQEPRGVPGQKEQGGAQEERRLDQGVEQTPQQGSEVPVKQLRVILLHKGGSRKMPMT